MKLSEFAEPASPVLARSDQETLRSEIRGHVGLCKADDSSPSAARSAVSMLLWTATTETVMYKVHSVLISTSASADLTLS
jgi:hypothetical protein